MNANTGRLSGTLDAPMMANAMRYGTGRAYKMRMTLCADCLKKGARGVNNGICSNSDGDSVNSTEHTDDQEEMVISCHSSIGRAPAS